jgi:hypothetical protein
MAAIQTPWTWLNNASARASNANASVPTVSNRTWRPNVNSATRPATCIGPTSEETSTASRAQEAGARQR